MTQAVKRACDACHRRKVKCDGVNPCRNCSQAQLSCTYNAIPQKKGPKGSRAKVISELRENQRQTSLSAKVQSRLQGVPCQPITSLTPTPGLLTSEIVKDCVNFYFEHMYAQLPILDRNQVEQQILYMEQNRDAYCLLASLCAFVMLQPGMNMPAGDLFNLDVMPGANIVSSNLLIEETLRVRKGYEFLDSITHNVVATNFFLFACSYGQELHDRAWFYLREATTMVHMAGMNKEEYYMQLSDAADASRRRRMFWLLYATERVFAIQRNRPLSLQASINLPTINDDPSDPLAHQLSNFVTLANLFKPFDDAFYTSWNKSRGAAQPPVVSQLAKQLNDVAQSYACQDSSFADLHTSQSWLKSTVWQLNNSGDESMSFQFPASMSREMLMSMASSFPGQGMELINSGFFEKLMEITHSTNELLSMQPAPRDPFAPSPHKHMSDILNVVAMSRTGEHRFLPVLLNKLAEILPRLATPMLQNAPDNPNLANIDIFDGFGNAGMAQPPPQMPLPMPEDYERKFPVEDYEKKYVGDMNGGTPESHATSNHSGPSVAQQSSDMNGSFSSPAMMSPGMEYPPNMNGFACTPMSESVMSPLGHPSQSNGMNGQQMQHQHQSQQQQQQQHMNSQQLGHGHDGMGHHMHNMRAQNMNQAAMQHTQHSMGTMYGMRQQPQRQNSYHMQAPPQMRTVGDFQGLQRAGSDNRSSMVQMGSMSNEIDFAALQ